MAEIVKTENNKFSLQGDIGFASAPTLLDSSLSMFTGITNAEIDLKSARALDSSAIAVLIEWARQFNLNGGEVIFKNVPDQFRRIAQISDIDSVLKFA